MKVIVLISVLFITSSYCFRPKHVSLPLLIGFTQSNLNSPNIQQLDNVYGISGGVASRMFFDNFVGLDLSIIYYQEGYKWKSGIYNGLVETNSIISSIGIVFNAWDLFQTGTGYSYGSVLNGQATANEGSYQYEGGFLGTTDFRDLQSFYVVLSKSLKWGLQISVVNRKTFDLFPSGENSPHDFLMNSTTLFFGYEIFKL